MIKNNIKALLIHIVISLISFIVYISFNTSSAKWASEEAYSQHQASILRISVLVIIVSLLLYYYFSKKFLSNHLSIIKNILSFSIVWGMGIILWFIALSSDLTNGSKVLLNSELWHLYSLYYGYSIQLVDQISITNPYIMLIFATFPIIIMYLGIKKSKIIEKQ